MPLPRLALLVLAVLAAAALTVAVGYVVAPMLGPEGAAAAVPLLIVLFTLARLVIGWLSRRR